MITGKPPIFAENSIDEVHAKFVRIIKKCRRNRPDERYRNLDELRDHLLRSQQLFDGVYRSIDEAVSLMTEAQEVGARLPDLVDHYLRNSDDRALYQETLTDWPSSLWKDVASRHPDAIELITDGFIHHTSGQLEFSYVDEVASTLTRIFHAYADVDIRERVLGHMLLTAHFHNRFAARSTFARLIGSLTDPIEIDLAVDMIRQQPDAAKWAAADIRSRNPMLAVVRALDEIDAQSDDW
jgi:hypothetical protein